MSKPKSAVVLKLDELQVKLDRTLKPLGYRRRGRIWNRSPEPDLVQVIGIQAGPYEFDSHLYGHPNFYGKFAINLGVYVRECFEGLNENFSYKTINDAYCEMRTRLENLDGRPDFYWSTNENVESLFDDIAGLLVGVGVPWLNRFASRDAILAEFANYEQGAGAWWWSVPRLSVAMIHLARGNEAAAKNLFEGQYRTSSHQSHQEHVQKLALRFGLGKLQN